MISFELKHSYMDIIIDSHIVTRKNAESSCVPFYPGFSIGNTLQNYNTTSKKLVLNQWSYRIFLSPQRSFILPLYTHTNLFSHFYNFVILRMFFKWNHVYPCETGFFHLAQQFGDSSRFYHISVVHSFLLLNPWWLRG